MKNFITIAKLLSLLNAFKLLHTGCSNTCRAAEVNAINNYSFTLLSLRKVINWLATMSTFATQQMFPRPVNKNHKAYSTMCFLFHVSCFLLLVFFPFTTVLSTIVFLVSLKFVNFYLGRYKTKNRIRSKKIRCKKWQKAEKTKSTL